MKEVVIYSTYWADLEQEQYSNYCTFENGVFKITNQKKFGIEVLSGVPLSSENGAYLIKTEVPLNGENISMPSVVNGGAYAPYFVSGGKLLSGELETTVVPISFKINNSTIIDAKGISGITDNGIEYFITLLK